MGRPRKPPARLVDKRASRTEGRLVPLPSQKVEAPEKAQKWLKSTEKAWADFWDSDLVTVVKPVDHEALTRLFDLIDERARLWKGYKKERIVEGSTGQVRISPMFDACLRLEKEIATAEARFGITPLSRSRLGLTFANKALSLDELNRRLQAQPAEASGSDPREETDPREEEQL